MQRCQVCSANVTQLRRGRCWGCYNRWVEARPVGLGAMCAMCGDRRRDNLRSVELLGTWLPTCHNCAGRAAVLDPMPRTIGGIRQALLRDRRRARRRVGRDDERASRYDRRTGERRRVRAFDEDDVIVVEDDMILEMEELAESLADELGARDPVDDELTGIREMPAP